jgi:hypothetical protein
VASHSRASRARSLANGCDTLIVAASDLRIMVYIAEPDAGDAERLAPAIVLGTQSLVD